MACPQQLRRFPPVKKRISTSRPTTKSWNVYDACLEILQSRRYLVPAMTFLFMVTTLSVCFNACPQSRRRLPVFSSASEVKVGDIVEAYYKKGASTDLIGQWCRGTVAVNDGRNGVINHNEVPIIWDHEQTKSYMEPHDVRTPEKVNGGWATIKWLGLEGWNNARKGVMKLSKGVAKLTTPFEKVMHAANNQPTTGEIEGYFVTGGYICAGIGTGLLALPGAANRLINLGVKGLGKGTLKIDPKRAPRPEWTKNWFGPKKPVQLKRWDSKGNEVRRLRLLASAKRAGATSISDHLLRHQ